MWSQSRKAFYLITLVVIGIVGCTDDYFDMDKLSNDLPGWNPDVSLPLVFTSLTASDILILADSSSDYTNIGSDGLISVVYRSQIFSVGINDLFTIPDIAFPFPLNLSAAEITQFGSQGSISKQFDNQVLFTVSPGGEELDSMTLAEGNLNFTINNSFAHAGTVTVTMANLKQGGVAFTKQYPIAANGALVASEDLAGYNMDLSATVNGFNELNVHYQLNLTNNGQNTNASQQVLVVQQFANLRFSRVFGYFAQKAIPIPRDSVHLDIFENALLGNISFVDPRFTFIVNNSFGIPVNLNLDFLGAYSSFNGILPITQTGIPVPALIASPTVNQIGQAATTTFTLNKDNSNIDNVLSQRVTEIIYELTANTNPAGHAFNFATDQSRIELITDMELPLWGRANNFTIIDTLPFPVPVELADMIDRGMIRVGTTNTFPIDGVLQLIFLDENNVVLDSLQQPPLQPVIQSGIIGANGIVTTATETKIDFEIPTEKVANVFGSTNMVVRASMNTANNTTTDVKLYEQYRLDVRLSVQLKLKLNPNQF